MYNATPPTQTPAALPVNPIEANAVNPQRETERAAPQGAYNDHVTRVETVLDLGGQTLTEILDVGNDEGNEPSTGSDGTNRYRSPKVPTTSPTPTQEGQPEYSPEQIDADKGIQQVMKRVDPLRSQSAKDRAEELQRQIDSLRKRVIACSVAGALVVGPAIYAAWAGITGAAPLEDPLTYVGLVLALASVCTWVDAVVKLGDGKLHLPAAAQQALKPG